MSGAPHDWIIVVLCLVCALEAVAGAFTQRALLLLQQRFLPAPALWRQTRLVGRLWSGLTALWLLVAVVWALIALRLL